MAEFLRTRPADRRFATAYNGALQAAKNVIDYDDAFVATETEAKEIVTKAKEFVPVVEHWIAKNHPSLKV